jgi:diguanylate cyclase (GGDEF)-like protein
MTGVEHVARPWGWLAVLIVGGLLVGFFYLLPAGSVEQSSVYDVVGAMGVMAAVAGVALHRPRGAPAWLFMAAGQLSFVLGDVLWTIYSAIGEDPFPSVADVAYLAGYPLLAIGLAIAIGRRIQGGDRAGLLDGAILAIGAGIAWWAIVLGPLADVADPAPVPFAISVAYPLGDLLLIGMALALAATPGARGVSFRFLMASLVAVLVADLVFGLMTLEDTYTDGSWVDAIWMIGYLLFGAAALHPSMGELVEPHPVAVTLLGPVRMVLLALAMLVGPALLMLERSTTDVVVVVAFATAVLSALVLARLAAMVRHLGLDIERRKALERQLAFQAFHDPLTGLANRRRFIAAVEGALNGSGPAAALFVDLDDFKDVNDNQGHDAGDALLVAVGERILASVRPDDVVGRLGGDEFAVLLTGREIETVAERVASRLVETLAVPVEIEREPAVVSASIGIAIRHGNERAEVDDLLRRADVAMYHAKARGKNRWATYTPEMDVDAATRPTVRRGALAATNTRATA